MYAMEAEIEFKQPQTKEYVGPPESGRGKEGLTSRNFGETRALLAP